MTSRSDLYYDAYDFEIDADPYPIWKRMRDESHGEGARRSARSDEGG